MAKYDSLPPKETLAPVERKQRDFSKEKPVSDALFKAYRSLYTYDRTPLDAVIEGTDDTSQYWIKQKVTLNAAYGNERFSLYIFLPKKVPPPFQTVVYFPGSNAIYQRSSQNLTLNGTAPLDLIIRSGRVLVYPVYKSTYERGDNWKISSFPDATSLYRDHVVEWAKDIRRAVDYVESRNDMDHDKLAYFGFSWGGSVAPVMLVVENRFKVAALLSGGFDNVAALPEVESFNFAPRVRIPILMVNGKYDFDSPEDSLQIPLFKSLGTAASDKRHVLLEAGHAPSREVSAKEILDWLDHYLGPVKVTPQN